MYGCLLIIEKGGKSTVRTVSKRYLRSMAQLGSNQSNFPRVFQFFKNKFSFVGLHYSFGNFKNIIE